MCKKRKAKTGFQESLDILDEHMPTFILGILFGYFLLMCVAWLIG